MSLKARSAQAAPLIWASVGALAIWLGFPNDLGDFPGLILLWPIALAAIAHSCASPRQALLLGWASAWAGGVAALYWLSMPVHIVGGLPWPLAFCCAIFIAFCLACQSAIFCCSIYYYKDSPALPLAMAAGCLWYLLELAFAHLAGFPWLALSGALAVWPALMQGSEFVGAYLWSAIWVFAALAIYFSMAKERARLMGIVVGILVIGGIGIYGFARLAQAPVNTEADGLKAIMVEGNIDQNQKWAPEFQLATLEHYIDLTAQALREAPVNGAKPLIIWPETALPFFFERNPALARLTRNCAISADAPLLFGAPGLAKAKALPEEAVYNRAFLLGPDGVTLGYYDKEHLVPFGEYLPKWLDFAFLQALLQGGGIYQEGSETAPLKYESLALGMLICYEGIFPWLAEKRVAAGANILIDISNDGWFGYTPAARQHLYLTVMRCLEQGRWLLRATNTGISAVVDDRGRIVKAGGQFQAGWLYGAAELKSGKTVYQHLAPWLPLGIGALFMALWAWMTLKKKNKWRKNG